MNTKIMSNQVYYVLARVGADSTGLYVESPDFDSAYNVAEERIAQRYKGPFTVQALQLIDVGNREHATRRLGIFNVTGESVAPRIHRLSGHPVSLLVRAFLEKFF